MRGSVAKDRFTRESARRILERPDLHSDDDLRDAATWLLVHGDWIDVVRATELMRCLDDGEAPRPMPPRTGFSAAEPSEAQRAAAVHGLVRNRLARLRRTGRPAGAPRKALIWALGALAGIVLAALGWRGLP
jgi:hypothetical protein